MDFTTYETSGHAAYARLAATIASILGVITAALPDLRVQQIQHRAKAPASLKKKILERGGALEDDVERHAKDVAGCRLLLYTNDDVARFVRAQAMWDNFEIDWERTKFHYPLDDADTGLFVSYNYVVKLKADRTALPEYADLADRWCEIQVQTTLDHAWSEMHHDTGYKPPEGSFGTAVIADVNARMAKIMKDHLAPAGYDFQKVSDDVRRMEQGRALFEQRPLEQIQGAIDNNRRYELIEGFREQVLPYLDDVDAQAPAIRAALRSAVDVARATPDTPIVYGDFSRSGRSQDDVAGTCLSLIDALRFRGEEAVPATWRLVSEMFDLAQTQDGRDRALKSIQRLAKNDIHVWNQVGPWVQGQVADLLAEAQADPGRRPIVIAAAKAILDPEVEGTTSASNMMTLHQGAVRPSDRLAAARSTAIASLDQLLSTPGATDQSAAFSALLTAAQLPYHGGSDRTLVELIDRNALQVVDIATRLALAAEPVFRARIERAMFDIYRNKGGVLEGDQDNAGLLAARDALMLGLERFHAAIDADPDFAIHKSLVGFDAIMPADWARKTFNFEARQGESDAAIAALVEGFSEATFDGFVPHLTRAAAIPTNDGATFLHFQDFLKRVGKAKPDLALRLLTSFDAELADFLSFLLDGLAESPRAADADRLVHAWIAEGRHLIPIMAACEQRMDDIALFEPCAAKALDGEDDAVIWRLISAASRISGVQPSVIHSALIPAIRRLGPTNVRWVDQTWFVWKGAYAEQLSNAETDDILGLLVDIPKLGTHAEWILAAIATANPEKALDCLGRRIDAESQRIAGQRYEAVPFSIDRLDEAFAGHPALVVDQARGWFKGQDYFEYSGGRLLHHVYPDLAPIEALLLPFAAGSDEDRQFLLRTLRAYDGNPSIDRVCRALVDGSEAGSDVWRDVELVIDSHGVLSGEFGLVEADTAKKGMLQTWLTDERPNVRQYAEGHILALDRQIASERRRAVEALNLRKRHYGEA
jgi:ppGpp synthetase/RelA/SpoT-type nucleotidyltranferase